MASPEDVDNEVPKMALPEDVVNDILYRLPVKVLLLIKSLSKAFKSLIEDPNFTKNYVKNAKDKNLVLLNKSNSKMYTLKLGETVHDLVEVVNPMEGTEILGSSVSENRTEILGCCNGVLCLCNNCQDLGLYNPSTRSFKKVAVPKTEAPPVYWRNMYTTLGFGYEYKTDDYIILRISQFQSDNEIKIYSSNSDSWKSIESFSCKDFGFFQHPGVFAANFVNFLVTPDPNLSPFIAAFNLSTEEFGKVSLPVNIGLKYCMSAMDSFLCLCSINTIGVDVWRLEEHGGWSKLFSIPNRSIPVPAYIKLVILVGIHEKRVIVQFDDQYMVLYDPDTAKSDLISNFDAVSDYFQAISFEVTPKVTTSATLDGGFVEVNPDL